MAANEDILPPGKIINLRWKVEKKLGKGSCGAVYKVIDLEKKGKAALKTEKHGDDKSLAVLKKEVDVLQKLKERKFVPRLICSGRRNEYDYFVMTLLGKNLFELKKECNLGVLSAGCVSRVGVFVLYGVKQLHEIGYLHRDIKPANMVIGRGKESRVIYVIDFGMARKFGIWENGVVRHRKARLEVLLRGTHRYVVIRGLRYCSPFVHERIEQGRRDDIFSILYSLIFLHTGKLPWVGIPSEEEIAKIKADTKDTALLENCPIEWLEIAKHIRTLTYEQRPDYKFLYDQFRTSMNRLKVNFSDLYDWEIAERTNRTQSLSQGASLEGKVNSREECKKPMEPIKGNPTVPSPKKETSQLSQQKKSAQIPANKEDEKDKDANKTEESAPRIEKANPMTVMTDPLSFISNDIGI